MDKQRLKAAADKIIAEAESVMEAYGPFSALSAEDQYLFARFDSAHSRMVSVLLKIGWKPY